LSIWDVNPDTLATSLEGSGFTANSQVAGVHWQPLCTINGTPVNDVLVGAPVDLWRRKRQDTHTTPTTPSTVRHYHTQITDRGDSITTS
jgi:hypothetical protein